MRTLQSDKGNLLKNKIMTNKNVMSLQSQKDEKSLWKSWSMEALTCRLEHTKVMHHLAKLYSGMLDENISARQAVYYFYGQVAATATLMPGDFSLGWRALALVAFCWAARKTRGNG